MDDDQTMGFIANGKVRLLRRMLKWYREYFGYTTYWGGGLSCLDAMIDHLSDQLKRDRCYSECLAHDVDVMECNLKCRE